MSKVCSKCGEEKPDTDFRKIGRRCRKCRNAYERDLNARNPVALRLTNKRYYETAQGRARHHDANLRNSTGFSLALRDELLERQGGLRAICSAPPKTRALCCDHDHNTGAPRALLCHRCNTAVGVLENPLLPAWQKYLILHKDSENGKNPV